MNTKTFDVFSNKFAYDIFKQKYSMDGTETWKDACTRTVNAVCGQLLDAKSKDIILKHMNNRKFIPGGRYLYSAGRPFHQVNNCFDGNTTFITDKGSRTLSQTVNQQVNVKNWKGEWEAAEVKSFGIQNLFRMTLSNGDEFLTTENHLWIQPDGSRLKTSEVKRVMLTEGNASLELDNEGIRHGIIYGDGYKHPNTGYTEIVIVNPKKDEPLVSYFENKEVEITVGFGAKRKYNTIRKVKAGTKVGLQPKHYKDLPITYTPEYARGFIAGLIATDGHASLGGSVIITCEGMEKAKKIREIAICGGCVSSSIRINSKVSPYDGSPREMCFIYLKPFSAPIILPYHKENMKRSFYKREMYLDVVNVTPSHQAEVFCVVAPKTNTFTLGNGVITSNCFLFKAEDSREGWADAMQKATLALMTGGGIGFDYSTLREEGAIIKKTGGTSTGPIALMNMINENGRYIMQGGQRRSAIWAGLQWDHKDIFKFMNLKNYSNEIKTIKDKDFTFPVPMELTNISVIYNTEFFVAMENKDHPKHEHANKVWLQNCKQAFSTAEPGMSFNFRKDNESARNACVAGDTEILTKDGYQQIESLVDEEVEIWNGFEWSKVVPKITGTNQEMVNVAFSDGRVLTCTRYHKFHISVDYLGNKEIITAEKLEPGMKLIKHKFPIIEHGPQLEDAYTQGFVAAEGMELNRTVYVYKPKEMCIKRLQGIKINKWEENNKRFRLILNRVPVSKNMVPIDYNLNSKLEWLSGLFDGDGTELKEGGLQLVSVNQQFLKDLQKLLSTVGIQCKILFANKAGMRMMPDHKGGNKEYMCQDAYRICIGAVQMQDLKKLGLNCERMSFNKAPQRDASQFITIVDVTEAGLAETVYCFDEPKNHTGIFNGIITGQCTEVVSEDDSDKCNLGTVWMNNITDKKEFAEVVKYATLFLLCGGIYSDVPNQKIKEVGNKNNRIGLGLGGMHDWLMQRGMPYEVTPELHKWLSIYEQESDAMAFVGAKQLGVSVPKGVRAIAPTGTIGILAESTTGIEPLFCKAYKRRYFKEGKWMMQYVVDGTVKRLVDKGIKLESIQDSYDLNFKQRVKFQADVQNYVDMAISSTCNMPSWDTEQNNEITLDKNSNILLKYAKRLRGFTVYPDGCRGGQPLTRVSLDEALANEGVVFEENETNCINGICGL